MYVCMYVCMHACREPWKIRRAYRDLLIIYLQLHQRTYTSSCFLLYITIFARSNFAPSVFSFFLFCRNIAISPPLMNETTFFHIVERTLRNPT